MASRPPTSPSTSPATTSPSGPATATPSKPPGRCSSTASGPASSPTSTRPTSTGSWTTSPETRQSRPGGGRLRPSTEPTGGDGSGGLLGLHLTVGEGEHLVLLAGVGPVLELDDPELLELRAQPAVGRVEQSKLLAVRHDL